MDDREYELKQTDVALKEREVTAREREVTAKENESSVSWWKNPLIVGLVAAALALAGNIITNVLSNLASEKAEHVRAQSNLVLEVIKTGNNEVTACKNLNFAVNIGWLDDANGAIYKVCGTTSGVPTLPTGASNWEEGRPFTATVIVEDADSHKPIDKAGVRLIRYQVDDDGRRNGGFKMETSFTDTKGTTTVSLGFLLDKIEVSQDGYETKTVGAWQLVSDSPVKIKLHRLPISTH
jgi:hypothetical protein